MEKEAKEDIRDWDETHEKMGKGVTLTKEELKDKRGTKRVKKTSE
jgi:hypothetical protein